MKKSFIGFVLIALTISTSVFAQDYYPVNDLPGATVASATTEPQPPSNKEYTITNCGDLTQNISVVLGVASVSPGSPERVGVQSGRLFRDGTAATCPSKAYPGNFNVGSNFNYHAIQFSNVSANPVCITVNVFVDGGVSPCGTNAHAMVYQSGNGLDETPYDPSDLGINFIGDIGSSISQPFSVTVNPGYFEIVFSNTSSQSNCDVAFNITTAPGDSGAIQCEPAPAVPMSNWPLYLAGLAILMVTVVGFRKRLV